MDFFMLARIPGELPVGTMTTFYIAAIIVGAISAILGDDPTK